MVLPVASNRPRVYAPGELIPSILTVPYNTFATFPFLKLPAELRNKIYDLVFPECRVQIIHNHPQKELAKWKRTHPVLRGCKPRFRLSRRMLATKDSQLSPVPLDMLEVCRKINEEATAFLYGRTTFQFDSIKAINKFLNLAPNNGIANITSIKITQVCFGETELTENDQWKRKADKTWARVCARVATELTSLQYLDIDLRAGTWPLQLKTTAPWTRPLMVLGGNGLHFVRITLRHYMHKDPHRLLMLARNLEDLMMTTKGREERDLEEALEVVREIERKEAEKAMLPPVRARKVLVIKLPPPDNADPQDEGLKKVNAAKDKAKSKPYYRTMGLEKYHRIDPSMVGVALC